MKLHFYVRFEELKIFNQTDYEEEDTLDFTIISKLELIENADSSKGKYNEIIKKLLEGSSHNQNSTLRVYESSNSLQNSNFYLSADGLWIEIGMKKEKLLKFYDEMRKTSNQIELEVYMGDEIENVTQESLDKDPFKASFNRYDITIKSKVSL